MVNGGQPTKSNGAWVWNAEDKQPTIDLSKIKETFMNDDKEFCIPDPPLEKAKEPEITYKSMELRSDWKASTSAAACQEMEHASNIKFFLQSCLKLIQDENMQLEVQRLIDYCDSATAERAVNQNKRYIWTG